MCTVGDLTAAVDRLRSAAVIVGALHAAAGHALDAAETTERIEALARYAAAAESSDAARTGVREAVAIAHVVENAARRALAAIDGR